MAKIKKGTYRFNDVLTMPSANIVQDIEFTTTINFQGVQIEASNTSIDLGFSTIDDGQTIFEVRYLTTSISPNIGLDLPINFYVYTTSPYSDVEGWGLEVADYDKGVQTITVPKDTDTSDEFGVWFTSNTKAVVPTADSVKAKIENLIAKANSTTGKSDADLTSGVNSLIEGYGQGGGGGNIVPLLVTENGTYDENAPMIVTEHFTSGEPDIMFDYFGITIPYFKAKKLVYSDGIAMILKNTELADKFYVTLQGNVVPLCEFESSINEDTATILYNSIPAVIWVKNATNVLEANSVYVVDMWSLGMDGDLSVTCLGKPETSADGFMPVEVMLPIEDELVVTPSWMEHQVFDEGVYYRKVVVPPMEREYLVVTPKDTVQTFETGSYNKCYSGVKVEAIDLTDLSNMHILCGIYLEELPKTEYKVGEGFTCMKDDNSSYSGAIMLQYTDGKEYRVNLTITEIENLAEIREKMRTVGTHTVKVKYTENNVTSRTIYNITVTE